MNPSRELLDLAYADLLAAAIAGVRCPRNGSGAITGATVGALGRLGRIRIDISRRNYRRVTILTGPHAGKSTAADPSGCRVWKTVGRVTKVNGKLFTGYYAKPPGLVR